MSFKYYIPDINKEWDEYWQKTSVETELELTKTDGLLSIFQKYLPKKGKILEAGCGMGKWIIKLSTQGYDITGVDVNDFALKKLHEHYPHVKTKKADVKKLPFSDSSFAAYLSLGVVEHFEEGPQLALKEAYRVLNNGGIAIIEVPFDSPLKQFTRNVEVLKKIIKTPVKLIFDWLKLRKKRKPMNLKFYEYRYTIEELKNFMKGTNFKNIRIFPKDDLAGNRSIALWLDYPFFQNKNSKLFELNSLGILVKSILNILSPFLYAALIVAVAEKN